MKIQYYIKNLTEATKDVKEKAEKKLSHLRKYTRTLDLNLIHIDISRDTHHKKGNVYRAEINAHVKGAVLRAVETSSALLDAIDKAAKRIDRQAREKKDKLVSARKKRTSPLKRST